MKNGNEVMMNATLSKYLGLKTEIARLEKEAEAIKSLLIPKGSFETNQFVVKVDIIEQMRTVSADQLCTVVDPVFVAEHNLVKTITFPKLTVKTKEL
jgi:hypothetical protein